MLFSFICMLVLLQPAKSDSYRSWKNGQRLDIRASVKRSVGYFHDSFQWMDKERSELIRSRNTEHKTRMKLKCKLLSGLIHWELLLQVSVSLRPFLKNLSRLQSKYKFIKHPLIFVFLQRRIFFLAIILSVTALALTPLALPSLTCLILLLLAATILPAPYPPTLKPSYGPLPATRGGTTSAWCYLILHRHQTSPAFCSVTQTTLKFAD